MLYNMVRSAAPKFASYDSQNSIMPYKKVRSAAPKKYNYQRHGEVLLSSGTRLESPRVAGDLIYIFEYFGAQKIPCPQHGEM